MTGSVAGEELHSLEESPIAPDWSCRDLLQQEMGCGSGRNRWCRLRDWQAVGEQDEIHEVLLASDGDISRTDLLTPFSAPDQNLQATNLAMQR
jgi:hypothetical protein